MKEIIGGMVAGFMLSRVVSPLLRNFFLAMIKLQDSFTADALTSAFLIALGAGIYLGLVDRFIPANISLAPPKNGGNS